MNILKIFLIKAGSLGICLTLIIYRGIDSFLEFNRKGGVPIMHDYENTVRFDAYVKAAMRYSLFRLRGKRKKITENEINSETVMMNMYIEEEFDFMENHVQVLNFNMTIKNDLLFDLLCTLEKRQRDVLYLSICENLSDLKIAGKLNMSRSAVQRLRVKTNKILQMKLGAIKNEEK